MPHPRHYSDEDTADMLILHKARRKARRERDQKHLIAMCAGQRALNEAVAIHADREARAAQGLPQWVYTTRNTPDYIDEGIAR